MVDKHDILIIFSRAYCDWMGLRCSVLDRMRTQARKSYSLRVPDPKGNKRCVSQLEDYGAATSGAYTVIGT